MFEKFKKADVTLKPNYILLPVTMMNSEDIDEFNEIYKYLIEQKWKKIERTPSGGIKKVRIRIPSWDVRSANNSIELTILSPEGFFRLQMRFSKFIEDKNGNEIYGSKAWKIFCGLCKKSGIDLQKYESENGIEIKKTIEKPMIKLKREMVRDKVFQSAYHVDFHSSYPAGLANRYPEFRSLLNELYLKRKVNKEYKAVLNLAIGYMQSVQCCKAKWAELSKAAIEDNNQRVRELSERLENAGRVILAYNTDGIWYTGEEYHGEGEGDGLGEWSNDHKNCMIRFKSAGSYEFIEDGVYHPVVRGKTKLDRMGVTRDQWTWGSIYTPEAAEIKFQFIEGVGIIRIEQEKGEYYYG